MHERKLPIFIGSADLQEGVALAESVQVVKLLGLKGKKNGFSTSSDLLRDYLDLSTFAQIPHKALALERNHLKNTK